MKARLWIVLAAIAVWAVSVIATADARRAQHVPLPTSEAAQLDDQANALCARRRADATTTITLPDGVLTCLTRSPS